MTASDLVREAEESDASLVIVVTDDRGIETHYIAVPIGEGVQWLYTWEDSPEAKTIDREAVEERVALREPDVYLETAEKSQYAKIREGE